MLLGKPAREHSWCPLFRGSVVPWKARVDSMLGPLKPSATVGIEHSRSHSNEMLGGFLSQLPNYEAYILQPFKESLGCLSLRFVSFLKLPAKQEGLLSSEKVVKR